jgi:hypothetical protein
MKKSLVSFAVVFLLAANSLPAHAHAGFDFRGVTPTKGKSSVVLLRIGHGCTAPDGVTKAATYSVSVVIPAEVLKAPASAAMQIPGWNATVTPSKEMDSAGVPISNTVTWSAKSDLFDVAPVGFAEFGIRGSWANPGTYWMDTTQLCRVGATTTTPGAIKSVKDPKTKKNIKVWVPGSATTSYTYYKISWNVHDSAAASTSNADKTEEIGPAPSLTIVG